MQNLLPQKNIFNNYLQKPILLIIIIIATFTLSGCVKYDLGINFNHTNNGELVQHIQISENLTSFSGNYVSEWLKSLERRAKKLQGSTERISSTDIIVKIPFTNSRELQTKFNSFFNKYNQDKKTENLEKDTELKQISANLIATDNNFIFLSRHHLTYDIDLRSLAALTSKENNLNTDQSILNLDFSLQTPWGIRNIQKTENSIQPEKNGKQQIWKLKPGQLNHIEVVFWLPNLLGIGTLIIVLIVFLGVYLKGYLGKAKIPNIQATTANN
ncbi:MAG: DUF3153 domain-containing protein [Nostocales cyanobacterium]|nr:MAG: DUF3153 domain-containing protein [Nostocales cyanobacterium]TAF09865.1 MAG: DUF3153 domain-containing protein [Nostocales cyanobacterium]